LPERMLNKSVSTPLMKLSPSHSSSEQAMTFPATGFVSNEAKAQGYSHYRGVSLSNSKSGDDQNIYLRKKLKKDVLHR